MSAMKTAARYFFSASVFIVILYLFNANDVLTTMAGANIVSVMIAVGFSLGAQLFSAIRLQQLLVLQDIMLSTWKVLFIGLSAVFYGLVIPGGTVAAFAVRFVQLSRNARIEFVAAALVVDRIIATVFLIAIGTITIAFDQIEPLWVGVMVTGTLFSVGFYMFGRRSSTWIIDRLDNVASNESPGRLRRFGMKICKSLSNYSTISNKQALIILIVSLLAHLCGCLAYYAIAIGIGLDLSFLSICWIRSGLILSVMIPVSVAGLGVREITAIGLLVPLGFGEAQAVGFAILIFLGTAVMPGLIGGFSELLGTTGRR
jgi:uncharacterized protein (TIRG00374 family)